MSTVYHDAELFQRYHRAVHKMLVDRLTTGDTFPAINDVIDLHDEVASRIGDENDQEGGGE